MEQVWQIVSQYGGIALAVLILVQLIMTAVAVHMVRKLTKYVVTITDKVQYYLQVVMAEEEEHEVSPETKGMVSGQERQMMDAIEQKKKVQQEELFNAVLQEIFP